MFTGIIEDLSKVENIEKDGELVHFTFSSSFVNELKIDQSVAHNGVCLTVVKIIDNTYTVTAIEETLNRSNLGELTIGSIVNVERCMKLGDRLDGHIVQGHVDQTGTCKKVEQLDGSWKYFFEYDTALGNVTVEKGSICINGVSLTVVDSNDNNFSVCIIPYTHEHTNFNTFEEGTKVNLEFDVVGKYIARLYNSQEGKV